MLSAWEDLGTADAVILAVPHRHYLQMPLEQLLGSLAETAVFIDVKSVIPREALERANIRYWRL